MAEQVKQDGLLTDEQIAAFSDSYLAKRQAQNRWDETHPEPQPPDKPEAVEVQPPQVVKHRNNGGLWFELEPGVHEDESHTRYRPTPPQTKLTLVFGSDKVVTIHLTMDQLDQLKTAVEVSLTAHANQQIRFNSWRDQQAAYEDDRHAWENARRKVGDEAETRWYELHPDAEDDDAV